MSSILELIVKEADDRKYPRELPPRPDDFPYDRDVSYGQLANYDRGSRKGSLSRALDPTRSIDNLPTDLGEVNGIPVDFEISGRGSGVGGGVSGPWSKATYLLQPEDPLDLHDVFDPSPVPVEPIPLPYSIYNVETDMELEPVDSLLLRVDEPQSLRKFMSSIEIFPKRTSWNDETLLDKRN
jgi:hypothetical protein